MTSAKCVGKGNQIFPKGEDPDLLLVEGGFGCKAIREKECTLSDQDYKIGWNCLDKVERQQWIVDIEEKWYRLEKLPASEVQVKKKKTRKRRQVTETEDIVEEDNEARDGQVAGPALHGVDGQAGDVE